MRLRGKVAIVTGAGRGIGEAIARLFAAEGAAVTLAARTEADIRRVADEIRVAGGRALPLPTDVSIAAQVQQMVQATIAAFHRLDILVNNAGTGVFATVPDTSEEDWDRTIAVNLKGTFLCCKYTVPAMIHCGGGVIISIGSTRGMSGYPAAAAYAASKAGVINLTRCLALDHVKQGIRAVCICPGSISTGNLQRFNEAYGDEAKYREFLASLEPEERAYYESIAAAPERLRWAREGRSPMGRRGLPEEVARVALFLASEEASFVNGAVITVDGGTMAGAG
ncbi:MAG: SDR family oxidoreductase [Chloroflexi bacterium]|nr:SDR family oxidoreductase [Chloroflexota bacterium]